SLSERLMEAPPPWLSPERTAWAAAETPWLRAWLRRIRCAQAGGPSAAGALAGAGEAPPPTVPMVDVPPVVSKPPLTPPVWLDLRLSAARETARFSGETAAAPPARATPPRPAATPDAPDSPMEERGYAVEGATAADSPPAAM